nr:MAG TPA: hypothetical protein [Caudoviricetes sp.]
MHLVRISYLYVSLCLAITIPHFITDYHTR